MVEQSSTSAKPKTKYPTPAEGFAKAKKAVEDEGGLIEAIKKSATRSQYSFWDNFAHAVANKLLGTEQGLVHLADALGIPKAPKVSTEKIDQLVKESRPTEGWGGVLGDVLATAPLAALGGGPLAQGIVQGLAGAASEPVRSDNYGDVKGTQLAIGAATGLAAGVLGRYLSGPAARNPEKWNKEILNAAAPPGSATIKEAGHEGVKALANAWDDAYAKVTPDLKVAADLQLATDLAHVVRNMPAQGATADEVQAVKNIIEGQIADPLAAQGNFLSGEAVNKIQSSLRKVAESKPAIADAVYAVRDNFLQAVERWSPDAAKELSTLRKQYPALLAVRKAAAKSTTDNGIFTPDQLASATSIVDKAGASVGEAPFQESIGAAREARVGKPGALAEIFSGIPLLGPLLRMAERSDAVRTSSEVVGKTAIGTAGEAAALMGREQPPAEQLPGTGTGVGVPELPGAPSDELNQRLDSFWGPQQGAGGMPSQQQQLDQLFAPPTQPGAAPPSELDQRLDQFWGPQQDPMQQMQFSPQTWGNAPPGHDPRFTSALRPMANRLATLGVSPAGIAGFLGNAAHESEGKPTAVGDNGTSIGLLQWHGPRKASLEDFARKRNGDAFNAVIQADYLVSELQQPQYAGLLRRLQTATDPHAAAMDIQRVFEVPAVINPQRGVTALKAANWLRSNAPIAAPSGRRMFMS